MYCLAGVIAAQSVLHELTGSVPATGILPLSGHLSLLPMTDALFDAMTIVGAATLDGFWQAPAGFGDALATCSATGPVGYVEADFLGGVGTQSAQAWAGGNVVLGSLPMAVGQPAPAAGTPISQALRRLGVVAGTHVDEFDAVGLGRHRRTEDWLPPAS